MRHVLIVSREFPPFIGGAATYAHALAISLSRHGVKPHVITTRTAEPRDMSQLKTDGITLTEVKPHKKLYLPLMANAYQTAIRGGVWDAIILADSSAIKMAALLPRPISGDTWAVFHGKEIETFFTDQSLAFRIGIGSKRIVNLLNRCRGVIAVSRDLASRISHGIAQLNSEIHVIPHYVDADFFHPLSPADRQAARSKLGLKRVSPIIFSAGRLVPGKGHETSIAACKALLRYFPQLRLYIAGVGPLKKELEHTIAEHRMASNVVLLGPLDRETMRTYFQVADVFLLPSDYESFGLVYIEANACGCFVIAGNNGGVKDVVQERTNGITIPSRSPDTIAEALRTFLEEIAPNEDTERNCRLVALTKFSPEQFANRTISLMLAPANTPL